MKLLDKVRENVYNVRMEREMLETQSIREIEVATPPPQCS